MRRFAVTICIVSICLTACDLVTPPVSDSTPAPDSASTPTIEASPTADNSQTLEPAETATDDSGELLLTVWTAENFAPTSGAAGGQTLVEQLAAFDDANPDIRVEVLVKRVRGPGSTLAYLRSAPAVAPEILPDIALLDREGLIQATGEGLIVPISPHLDTSLITGLYPVARDVGTVNDTMMGLPYLLEVQHSIYRDTVYETAPLTFADVLNAGRPYTFAAGTLRSVNQTALLHYLASGGSFVDGSGAPMLDAGALRTMLTFYAGGRDSGVLDPTLFQSTSAADAYAAYEARTTDFATVTSTDYLAGRADLRNTGVAPIPTPDGQPLALATGWSWVMVTTDPDRQAAAARLAAFLMDPSNLGEYSRDVNWLPSGRQALTVWGDSDPYTDFATNLLKDAVLIPDASLLLVVGPPLQDAVEAVLLTGTLPITAANTAAQTVSDGTSSSP